MEKEVHYVHCPEGRWINNVRGAGLLEVKAGQALSHQAGRRQEAQRPSDALGDAHFHRCPKHLGATCATKTLYSRKHRSHQL